MQDIKRDGIKKQKIELEILLAETGLLSLLKRIRFNPKPSQTTQETINPNQTRLVDFHMEISKKIDEVIQKNEEENTVEQSIVETRTTWTKTPQTPMFKTELLIEETKDFDNELFEIETPMNNNIEQSLQAEPFIQNLPVFVGPVEPKNTSVFAVGDHSNDKLLTTLGRIKINREKIKNSKQTTTKKKNGYSKAKNNYQEVKTELEKKKHELEEMKKLAKQKEEELKKKKQLKKEKEKQKAIELKKHEKEEKIKAKQELKIAKQKEKENKKQEKLKAKQELKLAKENQKQEKIEEFQQRKLEKQRQKELKEKEKLKLIKSKELEKQKLKDLKEKEKIKALKQKQLEEKKKKQETKTTKDKKPAKVNIFKKKETKKVEKTVKKPEIKTTEKEGQTNIQPPEDDLIKAFEIIDDLLGKLPDETIDEFVKSDDFEVYEKVVGKYKKK